MWGYIIYFVTLIVQKIVPSLYVRVYRSVRPPGQGAGSSLIICEGISCTPLWDANARAFPHYMWGYIADRQWQHNSLKVPSLYVRVYRRPYRVTFQPSVFPHYMWGYIVLRTQNAPFMKVPSLYVRVYHQHGKLLKSLKCSLIICEDISAQSAADRRQQPFPHYMWGYIPPAGRTAKRSFVPSLYMRVYRNWQWHPSGIKKYKCSWR